MKKFLIVGLGNVGDNYVNTRHNIGFQVLDALAKDQEVSFETEKLGDIARFRYKGRVFILVKPSTYMNLSGKASFCQIPFFELIVRCTHIVVC